MSLLLLLGTAILCLSGCAFHRHHLTVDAFSTLKTPTRGTMVRRQSYFVLYIDPARNRATYRTRQIVLPANSFDSKLDESAEHGEEHIPKNSDSTGEASNAVAKDTGMERKGAGSDGVGGYDPGESLRQEETVNVGDPQIKVVEKERSVTSILKMLAAIQQQGPQKYCILGTRHCSYLHQQIIELLAYALVLSGNHVYTSGAGGTHAATIRGALRAERSDLLTVVLPQSIEKQTKESQELLAKVEDVIDMSQNDDMSLDIASRICNSYLLSQTDQLISFAFHESNTVIEATKEAKKLDMLVTMLYLD